MGGRKNNLKGCFHQQFPQIYPQGSTRRDFLKYTLRGQPEEIPQIYPHFGGSNPKNNQFYFQRRTRSPQPTHRPLGVPLLAGPKHRTRLFTDNRDPTNIPSLRGVKPEELPRIQSTTQKPSTQQHTRLTNHVILSQGRDQFRLLEGEGEGSNPGLLPVPSGSRHTIG